MGGIDFGHIYFQFGKAKTLHWKQAIPAMNLFFSV
jgi:hypothetical protein